MMNAYADNAPFTVPGVSVAGRIIGPMNRKAPAPDCSVTMGRDAYGDFVRFETLPGDRSATDIKSRAPGSVPKRSMATFEREGNMPERYGARLAINTELLIEPGPALIENQNDGPHQTLAQFNAAPSTSGIANKSPPLEFGLVTINGRDEGGRLLKDASGRPLLFEHLELKVRALVGGQVEVVYRVMSDKPVVRGQIIRNIGIAFIDGRGDRAGLAELFIGGRKQGATYKGVTGYLYHRPVYFGFGVYGHVGQVPLAARFYGAREGLKG